MRSLLLLLFLALPASGDHGRVEWFDGSFEEALQAAGKSKRFVFVDFFTKNCPPCRSMDIDTFNETAVKEEAKSFVCLAIDAESEAGRPLAVRYGISSWPSLVFLEPDGTLRDLLVGFRKGDQLVREFHRVQSGLGTFGELERKVAANPADPIARLDLAVRLRGFPDERWAVEMERARASIAAGEGFDPKSTADRYAIAKRLAACYDAEGRDEQVAAIRALDPAGKSEGSRHLALDEVLAISGSDATAIRAFLASETHPSVLCDGYVALRDRLFRVAAAYEKQGLGPTAAATRAEARAAAKEAWKHCPPDRAAELGRRIAMDFAASAAELDAADRNFAVEVATKASALVPTSVDHLETLADCQELAGRTSEALATLRRASEIDPNRPSVRARLGRAAR